MNPEEYVGVGLLGMLSVVWWVVNPYILVLSTGLDVLSLKEAE